MDGGVQGMMKQDGSTLAFNRMGGSYWRKGYRATAPTTSGCRISRRKKITRLTDTNLKDFRTSRRTCTRCGAHDGHDLLLVRARAGIFNIWRIAPTGGAPQQVTSHNDDGVQFPSMSPDGTTIAYENEFEIWTLKTGQRHAHAGHDRPGVRSATTNLVSVRARRRTGRTASRPRPTATTPRSTSTARSSSSRPTRTSARSARSRSVSWRDSAAPSSRRTAAGSPTVRTNRRKRRSGCSIAQTGAEKKLTTHESFKSIDAWSPDSTRLAWTGDNRLFVADVESGPDDGARLQRGRRLQRRGVLAGRQVAGLRPSATPIRTPTSFLFEVDDASASSTSRRIRVERHAGHDHAGRHEGASSCPIATTACPAVRRCRSRALTEDPNDPLVRERQRRARRARRRRRRCAGDPASGGARRRGGAGRGRSAAGADDAERRRASTSARWR